MELPLTSFLRFGNFDQIRGRYVAQFFPIEPGFCPFSLFMRPTAAAKENFPPFEQKDKFSFLFLTMERERPKTSTRDMHI